MNDPTLPGEPFRTCCGMRCEICPASHLHRERADLARAAQLWAELFDVHLAPEQIACGGCRGETSALLDKSCPVRPCVMGKGIDDCSQCPDLPCEKLKRRWVSREETEARLGRKIQEDDYRKYVLPFENASYLGSVRRKTT